MTVVSVLARCDMPSNEHSEAAAFLSAGRQIARFCHCGLSNLSE